ncbi:MAG: Amuc_1102 family pilus-like protein [Verrucomicrobiales bacterium]
MGASLTPEAAAQEVKFKVEFDKPDYEMLQTPKFTVQGTKDKRFTPKEWLNVEVKFKVESNSSKVHFLEAITFKYYIVLNARDAEGKSKMLAADVNHVNVPLNEDIYSSCYVSPSALAVLLDKESSQVSQNDVLAVAVDAVLDGERIGVKTAGKGSGEWWEKLPPISGKILTKNQTPFHVMWWDRYAEVQAK